MKMTKRIIAVVMAVAMLSALLVGCSFGNSSNNSNTANNANNANNNNSSSAADSAVSSAVSSAASSEEDTEETIQGTGDNTSLDLSMTLFDVEYIVGKSRVKDLSDNDWGYDPEDWKDVDMDEKIEYKMNGGSYKSMDNSTTEVTISYKNLAETFATPEQCILSMLEFKGSPDGAIVKAGVKLFGGKVDLSTCTSFDEMDTAFKAVCSTFVKEKQYESEYTTSYTYEAELTDGNMRIYASFDNKANTMKDIDVTLTLNYDYTYQAD